MKILQHVINVLRRYFNMLSTWHRSIKDVAVRTLISHPTPPCCQRSITLHHQRLPSWWNMCWQRSIKDVVVRTLISHPTPPHIYMHTTQKKWAKAHRPPGTASATTHLKMVYTTYLWLWWWLGDGFWHCFDHVRDLPSIPWCPFTVPKRFHSWFLEDSSPRPMVNS